VTHLSGLVTVAGVWDAVIVPVYPVVFARAHIARIRHVIAVVVGLVIGIFTGVAGVGNGVVVVIECVVAGRADIVHVAYAIAVAVGTSGIAVSGIQVRVGCRVIV